MNRVIMIMLLTGLVTYGTRVLPLVFYKDQKPSPFVRSFLKYMPYGALGGLLFPGVLTATGDVRTSLIGAAISGILIWTNKNMIMVVTAGILGAYFAERVLGF